MSNTVELYAVTPTGDKLEHRCIAVNPYEIPLLFQLLCSHNPQLVPSRTLESVDVAQMITSNLKQQLRRDHAEVTRVDAAAEERLIRIFTEAPKQAPTDEEDEFFFPDFDAMSDEEYAAYLHNDIEKTELTSTPQENLHRLGCAAFGEFGDYYNFTQ